MFKVFLDISSYLTSQYPEKAPQLTAYQQVIIQASQNFTGLAPNLKYLNQDEESIKNLSPVFAMDSCQDLHTKLS